MNVTDNLGVSALALAEEYGDREMRDILRKAGNRTILQRIP